MKTNCAAHGFSVLCRYIELLIPIKSGRLLQFAGS